MPAFDAAYQSTTWIQHALAEVGSAGIAHGRHIQRSVSIDMSQRKLRRTGYEILDCEDVAGMERAHPASEILIVDGVYAPVHERGLVIEAGIPPMSDSVPVLPERRRDRHGVEVEYITSSDDHGRMPLPMVREVVEIDPGRPDLPGPAFCHRNPPAGRCGHRGTGYSNVRCGDRPPPSAW